MSGPQQEASAVLRPFVDREVDELLRGFVVLRAALAPALLLVAGVVVWLDASGWRRALIVGLCGVGVAGARISARRVSRGPANPLLAVNLLAMAALQLSVVATTGGLESPALPAVLLIAVMGSMLAGRGMVSRALVGLQVTVLVTLGALQGAGVAGALPIPALSAEAPRTALGYGLYTLVLMIMLGFGSQLGLGVRDRIERTIGRALAAREDELRTFAAHSQELESLSGEIAHELKNPLASIKGLAALVARDVPAGRASERLAVLRSEVDRMTSILDDFLAFSRPLTALSVAEVDLSELGRHVAEMHEATARARGVTVAVAEGTAVVRADQRKLVQVLINLVQNALDVAPPGSAVEIAASTDGVRARLAVLDRGPGLTPEEAARVMTPGVTTKAHGTGLGLPIARALAERHGGTLTLRAREGGGVVAELALPVRGPSVDSAAAAVDAAGAP